MDLIVFEQNRNQLHGAYQTAVPAAGDESELEAAARVFSGLSLEDRDLLAAVQGSLYRLITQEQFREFSTNTEYFVLESNICKVKAVGWCSIWMSFYPGAAGHH